MKYRARKAILESIRYVDRVVPCIDKDDSVAKSILKYKPDIFAKGGDRNKNNLPLQEIKACKLISTKIVYNVGGKKIQSSSWLCKKVRNGHKDK